LERTTNLLDWALTPDGVVTAAPAWEIRAVPVPAESSDPQAAFRLKAELR
jgi:hypothetical protein